MEPSKLKNFILNKGQKYVGHIKTSPDSNNWGCISIDLFLVKIVK